MMATRCPICADPQGAHHLSSTHTYTEGCDKYAAVEAMCAAYIDDVSDDLFLSTD